MHIELSQTGGVAYFPGLSKPESLDVENLPEAEQEELQRLIEAAGFFNLPDTVGMPARGSADYQYFILKIDDAGRQRTIHALVPLENAPLRKLIERIQSHLKAFRAASKKGSS